MAELVDQFVAVTGSDETTGQHLLESCDWDLERAVSVYLDTHGSDAGQGQAAGPQRFEPEPAAAQRHAFPAVEPQQPWQDADDQPRRPSSADADFDAAVAASLAESGACGGLAGAQPPPRRTLTPARLCRSARAFWAPARGARCAHSLQPLCSLSCSSCGCSGALSTMRAVQAAATSNDDDEDIQMLAQYSRQGGEARQPDIDLTEPGASPLQNQSLAAQTARVQWRPMAGGAAGPLA